MKVKLSWLALGLLAYAQLGWSKDQTDVEAKKVAKPAALFAEHDKATGETTFYVVEKLSEKLKTELPKMNQDEQLKVLDAIHDRVAPSGDDEESRKTREKNRIVSLKLRDAKATDATSAWWVGYRGYYGGYGYYGNYYRGYYGYGYGYPYSYAYGYPGYASYYNWYAPNYVYYGGYPYGYGYYGNAYVGGGIYYNPWRPYSVYWW